MSEWAGVGEAYAASNVALCAGTIGALSKTFGDGNGRALLDVGSGTGALASTLASADWFVTGCEPEPTMRTVAEREHPELRLVDGALPALPFPDASFEAVVANFVLNHVSNPRVAAREMARVVASEATLAATIWLSTPPWFWRDVCAGADLEPAKGVGLAPENEFVRTAEGFAGMLSDGGWQDVDVEELTWTWNATPEELWTSAEGGVGTVGSFYLALSESARARFRASFDLVCVEHLVDGAVPLEHTAAVAVSRGR